MERIVEIEIDRSRCALCGGPNDCALAARTSGDPADPKEAPCWCVDHVFPEALTRAATAKDGGGACVCRACLERNASD